MAGGDVARGIRLGLSPPSLGLNLQVTTRPARIHMGIEAFLWRYENGEIAAMDVSRIREALRPFTRDFHPETGVLRVEFDREIDSCDFYLGVHAAETGRTEGLMISRPITDARLWQCVLEIMRMGNIILFFSDDSTPLHATENAPAHFPADLLDSLGAPKLVTSPHEIVDRRSAR
jgi:hypothetical protein